MVPQVKLAIIYVNTIHGALSRSRYIFLSAICVLPHSAVQVIACTAGEGAIINSSEKPISSPTGEGNA